MTRTQCEAAELAKGAASNLTNISAGIGALGIAVGPSAPLLGTTLEAVAFAIGFGITKDVSDRADRLARNCRVESFVIPIGRLGSLL